MKLKGLIRIKEDMGGVSAPMSTTVNTPGMGNATPATSAAMSGSQQYSKSCIGSGDKWGNSLGKINTQGKTKKVYVKKKKKQTNEQFYPYLDEEQINPYDSLGTAMAKKLKVPMTFKKGKNNIIKNK